MKVLGIVPIMAKNARYTWGTMNDDQLIKRLEEETKKATRALDKRDRAIASRNALAISKEQIRRYEEHWGL